jgi:hypothetical protein
VSFAVCEEKLAEVGSLGVWMAQLSNKGTSQQNNPLLPWLQQFHLKDTVSRLGNGCLIVRVVSFLSNTPVVDSHLFRRNSKTTTLLSRTIGRTMLDSLQPGQPAGINKAMVRRANQTFLVTRAQTCCIPQIVAEKKSNVCFM